MSLPAKVVQLGRPSRGIPADFSWRIAIFGIEVSQTTVAKYMVRYRKPPSQTWRTFLDNPVKELVSIGFFTVPTATFRILYVLLVLRDERRQVVHFNVTEHPRSNGRHSK